MNDPQPVKPHLLTTLANAAKATAAENSALEAVDKALNISQDTPHNPYTLAELLDQLVTLQQRHQKEIAEHTTRIAAKINYINSAIK